MSKSLIRSFSLLVLFFGIFVGIQAQAAGCFVIFPERRLVLEKLENMRLHFFVEQSGVLSLASKELTPVKFVTELDQARKNFRRILIEEYNIDQSVVKKESLRLWLKQNGIIRAFLAEDPEAEKVLKDKGILTKDQIVIFPDAKTLDEIFEKFKIASFMTRQEYMKIVQSRLTLIQLLEEFEDIFYNYDDSKLSVEGIYKRYEIGQKILPIINHLLQDDDRGLQGLGLKDLKNKFHKDGRHYSTYFVPAKNDEE